MAILKIRDEHGMVHEIAALKGEKGEAGQVDYRVVAPALKGRAVGCPVLIGDSSPLEHDVSVTVPTGGVVIKKYGKNLFTVQDGVTIPANKGSFDAETQTLTIADDTLLFPVTFDTPLPVGTTYSITLKTFGGKSQNHKLTVGAYHMGTGGGDANAWQGFVEADKDVALSGQIYTGTFTNTKTVECIAIQMYGDVNVLEPLVFQVQFELGNVTDYEPYVEPVTYTADENGAVSGITAQGDGMTLFAVPPEPIAAEYNRDINKAFAELLNRMTGG